MPLSKFKITAFAADIFLKKYKSYRQDLKFEQSMIKYCYIIKIYKKEKLGLCHQILTT